MLIVEDYDDTRELLRFILEARGCHVLEARDGREAVDMAPREHPDLILMDLSLPVMNGIEATREIHRHQECRDIPVVAVSAHCKEWVWMREAREAGCLECLAKPVDFDQINEVMGRFGLDC
ncbi:MAG TPA: response regulator [Acidobacteriaceae bacterium]|nr:response regulator [Acidobacteriaceae bacterium]